MSRSLFSHKRRSCRIRHDELAEYATIGSAGLKRRRVSDDRDAARFHRTEGTSAEHPVYRIARLGFHGLGDSTPRIPAESPATRLQDRGPRVPSTPPFRARWNPSTFQPRRTAGYQACAILKPNLKTKVQQGLIGYRHPLDGRFYATEACKDPFERIAMTDIRRLVAQSTRLELFAPSVDVEHVELPRDPMGQPMQVYGFSSPAGHDTSTSRTSGTT